MKKVQAKDHPVSNVVGVLLKMWCHTFFFELTHQVVFVLRRKSPGQVNRVGVVRCRELYHGFVCAGLGLLTRCDVSTVFSFVCVIVLRVTGQNGMSKRSGFAFTCFRAKV